MGHITRLIHLLLREPLIKSGLDFQEKWVDLRRKSRKISRYLFVSQFEVRVTRHARESGHP